MKALERPLGMARFATLEARVMHVQCSGRPRSTAGSSARARRSSSRRTTSSRAAPRRKTSLWRTLFGRCDRVVVHSERGRASLARFGVPEERLRVIPHPAFRSDVARADDGRTALLFGLIRPYKGVEDAVEAVLREPTARGCWWRATRASRSTASSGRRASVRSGGSASFRTRRSGAR